MSASSTGHFERHHEALRLIGIAKAILDAPAEQLAQDYLDHAAAVLQDLDDADDVKSPSTPPEPDHG